MATDLLEPPVARSNKKTDRFEFLVEPQWVKRVEKQAKRFGMTASAYVRLAVTEKLERDEGGSRLSRTFGPND